jgi:tRNA G18 (ribose-2'-O)-methylase SpoU
MKFPLTVVLDNIRSALNVGAIFRTSDGAGIQKLYLTGITPYPPHNKIPKTALGSIDMIEWEHNKDTVSVIKQLKENGHKIVCAELTKDAKVYTEDVYDKPTALVFGHEINGISEEILQLADEKVYIPMHGDKQSLNVATSYGIISYEIIRQWTGGFK